MNKREAKANVVPLLITVEDVAIMLSVGKTMVYYLIAKDGLPVHRFGKSVRVNKDELENWLVERRAEIA